MKILVAGDSWNRGYGVEENEKWTSLLGHHDILNVSVSGSGNNAIQRQIMGNYNYPDLIIVGWSSIGRKYLTPNRPRYEEFFELSYNPDAPENLKQQRLDYFQSANISDLIEDFKKIVQEVEDLPCKVLHYTVFGEEIPIDVKHKLDISMLEYLASCNGNKFLFDIPMFEYDYLHENTYTLAENIMKRHPNNEDWEYACFERELVILEKNEYFLDCGHPSPLGHRSWSEKIEQEIQRI